MRKGVLLYILLFVALLLFIGPLFIRNITWLLSERALTGLIEFRYDFVLLYVIIFSSFIVFLIIPFKHNKWQHCNAVYVAFIIALFTEMFGFPLTIYLLSSMMPLPSPDFDPAVTLSVNVPGLNFRLLSTSVVAGTVSIIAALIIIFGWKDIYQNRKSGKLVTHGIYKYMRHPQYTGIILVITAWLFAWPTLPTLIMWPILTLAYYKLAKREEKEMISKFGKEYEDYKKRVPMFLPGWNW